MCGPMSAPSWRCCRPSLTLVRVHGGGEGGWGRSLELRIHAWSLDRATGRVLCTAPKVCAVLTGCRAGDAAAASSGTAPSGGGGGCCCSVM